MTALKKHQPDPFSSGNNKGETKKTEPTYIERFLQGNNILERLEDCVTRVVKDALAEDSAFVPGSISQDAYSRSATAIREALLEFGFVAYTPRNQVRLLSSEKFFAPVQLRFARGRMMPGEGCIIFNSRKGPETYEGIRQNYQHFHPQMPLDLESDELLVPEEKILNLWVIYEFDREYLTAWLVEGTEKHSGTRMFCDEHMLICSKSLIEIPVIEKNLPPRPPSVDINVPFKKKEVSG